MRFKVFEQLTEKGNSYRYIYIKKKNMVTGADMYRKMIVHFKKGNPVNGFITVEEISFDFSNYSRERRLMDKLTGKEVKVDVTTEVLSINVWKWTKTPEDIAKDREYASKGYSFIKEFKPSQISLRPKTNVNKTNVDTIKASTTKVDVFGIDDLQAIDLPF